MGIWLWLMLSMFSLPSAPTGTPAPPATLYRYVAPKATVVVSLDARSLTAHWFKRLDALANEPFVKAVPELSTLHARGVQMLKLQLAMLQKRLGVDPTKHVRYVTASMELKAVGLPQYLVIFGGTFPASLHAEVAKMLGLTTPTTSGAFTIYYSGNPLTPGVAATKGVIILGSENLLRALPTLRPAAGALAQRMLRLHSKSAILAGGVTPDATLIAKLEAELHGPYKTLVKGLSAAHLLLTYRGARVSLWSGQSSVRERYAKLLSGFGALLRALPLGISGTLKMVDGVLVPNDRSVPLFVRKVLSQKASLLAYLKRSLPGGTVRTKVTQRGAGAHLEVDGAAVHGAVFTGLGLLFFLMVSM